MCDYAQREFSCGHFRWLATKHCAKYKHKTGGTKSPCLPDITAFEERPIICGECRFKLEDLPWPFVLMERILAAARP